MSSLYKHITDQLESYYEHHNCGPSHVWLNPKLYATFRKEISSSMQYKWNYSDQPTSPARMRWCFILTPNSCVVEVVASTEIDEGYVLVGKSQDLFNFVAERELLCATIGASTVGIVTTTEKIRSEE